MVSKRQKNILKKNPYYHWSGEDFSRLSEREQNKAFKGAGTLITGTSGCRGE